MLNYITNKRIQKKNSIKSFQKGWAWISQMQFSISAPKLRPLAKRLKLAEGKWKFDDWQIELKMQFIK